MHQTGTKREMRPKIEAPHKDFIRLMLARRFKIHQIARYLNDKDMASEFDFPPIDINPSSVWKHVHKFVKEDELEAIRERYYQNLTDIRLTSKKERLTELQRMFDQTSDPNEKVMIFKEVRTELGEDFDKWLNAMKESGNKTYINYNFGGLADDDRDSIRANIAAAYRF